MQFSNFKFVLCMMAFAFALQFGGPLHAQETAKKHEPHPTFVAFLEELKAGQLEQAAKRIASVNDLFGRSRHFLYFPPADLMELLATCELSAHKSIRAHVAIERTTWKCSDSNNYSMIFFSAGDAPNPYLYVGRIETDEQREARKARIAKRMTSGQFPLPRPVITAPPTAKELAEKGERLRLEALQIAERRDILGDAVLSGKLDEIAEFVTQSADAAYITHDPYFDVKIKHINGFGWTDTQFVLRQAITEFGKPVAVKCRLGEGKSAPHICEWQLENPDNTLRAEMNFNGEGGTLNSIRIFRSTPEERAELRQQAIDLGVIES